MMSINTWKNYLVEPNPIKDQSVIILTVVSTVRLIIILVIPSTVVEIYISMQYPLMAIPKALTHSTLKAMIKH